MDSAGSVRERLVQLLKDRGFVSGTEIGLRLGISRSAVWKHVRALREEGFAILGSPRRGYRLADVPDTLSPPVVLPFLSGGFGKPYRYYPVTSSTNDRAKELAQSGAPEGTVVVAEQQTGGRGRRGRSWHSPPGGLWFSLLLRPDVAPAETQTLPLLLSVAVARGIEEYLGLHPDLKWPNDILLGGRKAGGILAEIGAETERVHHVVAGIGLNVNIASFPPELETTATSLQIQWGGKISRARLLGVLLAVIEEDYRRWCRTGFAPFHAAYQKRCSFLGKEVAVVAAGGVLTGLAAGVDAAGRLLLSVPGGEVKRLSGGEVTVREEGAVAAGSGYR
ncbi:MAG: biotin--[acetyl-CoA-carboxylase] ligase [Bacillota bacterium]|nr:biotin--[acetyl-CoA-carboxylase] ligase [Thermoanaerobacteraceae bacterium]